MAKTAIVLRYCSLVDLKMFCFITIPFIKQTVIKIIHIGVNRLKLIYDIKIQMYYPVKNYDFLIREYPP